MRFFYLCLMSLLTIIYSTPVALAQEADPSQELVTSQVPNPYLEYNPNSLNPIPEAHIMFRRRVWKEIYLQEKQNKPFFARNKEITKLIIEGAKQGVLTPYTDESLTTEMTKEQFFENLSLPKEEVLSAEEKALGFTDDAGWGDEKLSAPAATEEEYFLPHEVTTLELMEDVIFDKVRSKLIHDIQTIKLIIPADKFPTGLCRVVATFKYKDLAAYFDSKPKEAVWINVKNSAGNIKLTEAFEIKLFGSRIVKIENPDDATVDDLYNKTPGEGIMASQQLEEELTELEYFLWEN